VDPKEVEKERRARTMEHLKAVLMTLDERFTDAVPAELKVERNAMLSDYIEEQIYAV
jgi:hypothetical protein